MFENIYNFLISNLEIVYAVSVTMLTFIILKYIIPRPSSIQKLIVLISSGVILGSIFIIFFEVRWPIMILAFLSSIGLYELIIKQIMRYFGVSYQNGENIK